jgi:hypothetical protein
MEVMMQTETIREVIVHFLRKLIIVDLIIFVGSAGLNYLLGWHTLWDYGNTVMWAGIIIVVLVGMNAVGATGLRGSHLGGLSVSHTKNMDKHTQQWAALEDSRIGQAIQYLLIAAVPIIVGTILQS